MYMDVGMDTGDMILKEELEIGEDETTGEEQERHYLVPAGNYKIGSNGLGTIAKTFKIVAEQAPDSPSGI